MIIRKLKVFVAYLFVLCLTFLIGGLIFEFFLIPLLIMLTADAGYQLPTMERFVLLARVICLVCPVGALIATILLDRR
ncbi:hypothetical protein A7J67_25585 [Achromobacter xylosoxidans]|nr:hypothetical protein A7J67_25585 [Achromobacter xylosoxidans]